MTSQKDVNEALVILTKTSEDHDNVMSQAKRIRYATSVSKICQIFFLYKKNISLPSGAYIVRVPGAPSSEGL